MLDLRGGISFAYIYMGQARKRPDRTERNVDGNIKHLLKLQSLKDKLTHMQHKLFTRR